MFLNVAMSDNMHFGRELDEEVLAALADVQARQQNLARGSVLPRASPPPASAHATSSHPPPASKDKTQRVAPFQWLKRRVVRRNDQKESAALEDLGSLELVPSASLATARTLIGDFIALPARREFVFVHPITNTHVDTTEEKNVCVADIPFICIVLLPMKANAATGK
ncbi:Hypothetical protein PHPALM_19 [Phytophthora palmivora]|uniref:Uncharacterized protein n=1 Tax=Phytophthora palmivora TaxID=4796 RepID=A0A2P4YVY1_9STRA|nr:Hypothetical protein PHPALM_19 [Phytophthora palmivora]